MSFQCPHCQSSIVIEGKPPREIVCPSCGSSIELDTDGTIGWLPGDAPKYVGRYEFIEQLGIGSFGTVYKARDSELGRFVAVKIPRSGSILKTGEMERFLREARSAAQLKHPGIVSLYDAGTIDGLCCLVSEFIHGTTLSERIRVKRFNFHQTAELMVQVAEALHYAHEQGVIHRDLKPSNIILDLEGRPHLMDFGLAKRAADEVTVTLDGQVLGTPAYMSPEQARGEMHRVDARSDVYSLGVILYELLTGELPFRGQTRMLIVQVIQDEPRPPRRINDRIPRDLETICLKAMVKDPARRYTSAQEFAADLRRYLQGEPIHAHPIGPLEKLWRWSRRNPALASAAAALVATLLVGATISSTFALMAQREAERAARNEHLAEERAKEAAAERDTAQAAERESRRRLIRLHILTGTRALESHEPELALQYFYQAWQLDQPMAEPSHRARLAGVLQIMPELLGACFHDTQVSDAAFSPDSTRVLTRTDSNVCYLWDYQQARLATPPLVHADRVLHVCFSPDGAAVATASADGSATIWDARTGMRLHTLHHEQSVHWITYHPDGQRVLTASEDGNLRLWNAQTGAASDQTLLQGTIFDYVEFSQDGRRFLTAGRDHVVRVWSLDPIEPVSPRIPYRAPSATERYSFHYDRWPRFGSDGQTVISFHADTLFVWPGYGDDFISFSVGYNITEVYPIPGFQRLLATGDKYNRVAVIDLQSGEDVYVMSHPRQANIGSVSSDGRHLMTASSGGLIHLRNASTGALVWPPQKCADFASVVRFSPDSRRCLAASQDGTVRVWSVEPPRLNVSVLTGNEANGLTYPSPDGWTSTMSPDGTQSVSYDGSGNVEVKLRFEKRNLSHNEPVDAVLYAVDGDHLVLFGPETTRLWDARSLHPAGPALRVATTGRGIGVERFGRLSGDGLRLATWDDERTVSVWDLKRGERIFGQARLDDSGPTIFGPPELRGHITGLILSADGRWLAAATNSSGALSVWNVDSGELAHHTPKRFQGFVQGFAFSADGERILLWASDNTARVYDTSSGVPIGPTMNPTLTKNQYVRIHPNESAISADGNWIAIFDSGQQMIRLYDTYSADRLLEVSIPNDLLPSTDGTRSPISRLWFSGDRGRINFAVADRAYTIQIPSFHVPTDATGPLLLFLTGHRIDPTVGIERVDPAIFRSNPQIYQSAFQNWKGVTAIDSPGAEVH